jgi:hypothetical protein
MRHFKHTLCGLWISIALVATAVAATPPSVSEIQKSVLKTLDEDSSFVGQLSGLPTLPASKQATREFILDLFTDEAFVLSTSKWLAELRRQPDTAQAKQQWVSHFQDTVSTGMALLDDDDLNFIVHTSAMRVFSLEPAACEAVFGKKLSNEEVDKLWTPPPHELKRYFDIFKRAYLGAVNNEVPRKMPSEDEVAMASMKVFARLDEKDQEDILLVLSGKIEGMGPDKQCSAMRRYLAALNATPGDAGKLLRRELVVNSYRTAVNPPAAHGVAAPVDGAHTGQFQPGLAVIEYPRAAAKEGIEGEMMLTITVDESGDATRITASGHKFSKPFAILSGGQHLSVEEMFDPVAINYYRSGKFMRRYKDGKPIAYQAQVPMVWTLKQ